MTAAVAALAKKDGFDLILLDDRSINVPDDASYAEVNNTILNKRVLFASDTIDLTQRLITMMNNDFSAGVGGNNR